MSGIAQRQDTARRAPVAGAALAGLTMLLFQIRRRPIPLALVAGHGLLGITGYTLLMTYLTMLY